MGMAAQEKYGIPADRLAQAQRVAEARVMTPVEHKLDPRMRDAFALVHGADGNVPSDAILNIRSNDHHPWRIMARRYTEMHEKKTPVAQAAKTLDEFRAWLVEDLYGLPPGTVV